MHVNIALLNTKLSALTLALLFVISMAGSGWAQDVNLRQDHLLKNTAIEGQPALHVFEQGSETDRWAIAFSARNGVGSGNVSLAGKGGPGDNLYDDFKVAEDSTGMSNGGGSGGSGGTGGDDYDRFGQDHAAFGIDGTARRPNEVAVVGNYPNPFNPETTIRFEVHAAQQVQLAVYNALGQRVRMLVDGRVEAGAHEARFDAYGLPSGTYFSRLITEAGVVTRTMVLAR